MPDSLLQEDGFEASVRLGGRRSHSDDFSSRAALRHSAAHRQGPMVRIHLPPAARQANFRIAPLARPHLVERQPELLAHHLTAAGDIDRVVTQWLKAGAGMSCAPAR